MYSTLNVFNVTFICVARKVSSGWRYCPPNELPNPVKGKSACSCTSTPSQIFMVWCLIKHRDNSVFTCLVFLIACDIRIPSHEHFFEIKKLLLIRPYAVFYIKRKNINFNITILLIPMSWNWSLPFGFSDQNPVGISHPNHACYMLPRKYRN